MEKRSRVERYKELRQKIANMDVYSFQETKSVRRNLPPRHEEEVSDAPSEEGIKKNTLTLSIDQLISEHDKALEKEKRKEEKALYARKKWQGNAKRIALVSALVVLFVLAALVVLVVLFVKGVL